MADPLKPRRWQGFDYLCLECGSECSEVEIVHLIN